MAWKTQIRNLVNLDVVNRYFEELLEVKLPLKLQPAGDLSLQGIDIVRTCEKVAEENRVVINVDTVYMHECFMVYLHAEDYRRLEPLLDEIRKDAIEHLESLKKIKHYKVRGAFSIEFQKEPRVGQGTCIVVSSTRKKLIRTVIDSVHLPPDSPLSLDGSKVELTDSQAGALREVFWFFDKGNREEAHQAIQRLNGEYPDWMAGQLIECLFWFIRGDSAAGLRYLNTHPKLMKSELGGYLRALAYLDVADLSRAGELHRRTFQRQPNALGYLVKGLIDLARDHRDTAAKELKLAATMEPLFKHLPGTYLRQHAHLSRVSRQGVASHDTQAPHFLRLVSPFSRVSYNICVQKSLDIQVLKGSRLADLILKPVPTAEKRHLRLARDAQHLWLFLQEFAVETLMINGKPYTSEEGYRLVNEDILQLGQHTFEYEYRRIKAGPKFKLGQRSDQLGCHFFKVIDGGVTKETWIFPVDQAMTVGRGRGRGNDLLLDDTGISAEHGEFTWESGDFFFRDKQSTNGTAKNGRRFDGKVALLHGDVLQLAGLSLEVRYGGVISSLNESFIQ